MQKRQVSIGSAKQQDFGHEGIAACEYGEVLHDNGISKRVHDLIGGNGGFDKVDNICFGKDTALGSDMVQFIGLEREFLYRFVLHTDFHGTLFDGRTGTGGTLVIHGGEYGFFAVFTLFKVDDLRILTTQFNDRTDIRVQMFYR